ncbi:MAG: homocysteine S-methyltransferase family protein [Thermoanaerobaculia bacterium]
MGAVPVFFRSGRPVLWDGGMGTQLQARGLAPGDAPERFNLTHPETVAAVHRDYYSAGAEGVETNTFGANRIGLDRYDLGGRTVEINRVAAELARSVCPAGRWVAGSIGPTGQIPEPHGTCPASAMYDAFAEQAVALKQGGVDLFIVETMVDLGEISEAVRACVREAGLPTAALMTFDPVKQGFRTVMGVSPVQAAETLLALGACAVGTNCSNSIEVMVEIARDFRGSGVTAPLVVMPNAGTPELVAMKTVYRETPERMAAHVPALVEAGADVIGGCCGTTPEHIRKFREVLQALPAAV